MQGSPFPGLETLCLLMLVKIDSSFTFNSFKSKDVEFPEHTKKCGAFLLFTYCLDCPSFTGLRRLTFYFN